jgi:hypothetical protein
LGVSSDLSIACLSDLLMLLVFGEKGCPRKDSIALRPKGPARWLEHWAARSGNSVRVIQ